MIGPHIAARRRGLVLFLRRLGLGGTSELATFAVAAALGRRFPIVTLDSLHPSSVGEQDARKWNAARWLALALLCIGIVASIQWLRHEAPSLIEGLTIAAMESAVPKGSSVWEIIVGVIVGIGVAVLLTMITVPMVGIAGLATLLGIGAFTLLSWTTWCGTRRAERHHTFTVGDPGAVHATVLQILRRSRGLLAPRLIVVRSTDRAWRDLVCALAKEATLVLIDVSEPSENLVRELDMLSTLCDNEPLLISRRDRVEALLSGEGAVSPGVRDAFIRQLEGRDVLVYEPQGDKRSRTRFVDDLRGHLHSLA